MSGGRPKNMTDIAGQQFKHLSVIERAEKPGYWRCKCVCGNEVVVIISALLTEKIRSCGCIAKKNDRRTKHPLFAVWSGIMRRVRIKDFVQPNIDVDPRWASDFWTFVADVPERPSQKHTLFRIDPTRGFYPDNVEWTTRGERGRQRGRFGWEYKQKSSPTQ